MNEWVCVQCVVTKHKNQCETKYRISLKNAFTVCVWKIGLWWSDDVIFIEKKIAASNLGEILKNLVYFQEKFANNTCLVHILQFNILHSLQTKHILIAEESTLNSPAAESMKRLIFGQNCVFFRLRLTCWCPNWFWCCRHRHENHHRCRCC